MTWLIYKNVILNYEVCTYKFNGFRILCYIKSGTHCRRKSALALRTSISDKLSTFFVGAFSVYTHKNFKPGIFIDFYFIAEYGRFLRSFNTSICTIDSVNALNRMI